MTAGSSLLLVCIALCGSLAAEQQNTRDTAGVSGIVTTTAPNPQPIRRVVVTISGGELPTGRAAITDDNGRFSIDGLPAGRYTLSAKKPAYLPATYGASRPGRPGIELAITSGQRVTNLSIVMTHGAAIGGVIRDSKGVPLPNARVSITRRLPDGTLAPASTTTSDDRGQYRIFGLTPGEYLVNATESSLIATTAGAPTTAEMDATLAALRAGRTAGRPAAASTAALPPIHGRRAWVEHLTYARTSAATCWSFGKCLVPIDRCLNGNGVSVPRNKVGAGRLGTAKDTVSGRIGVVGKPFCRVGHCRILGL